MLDTGNGATFRIAPEVFRRAGAEVVVINDQPNGRNINDHCGAMHPEGLAKTVVAEKADFGVAFDGDADRAIFVDDAGKIRDGDEIIYLWAQRLKRNGALKNGCVVTTVMSNYGFEQQLRDDGIELCRANVGDKYVLEMMIERGAILGGEQSGHIIDLAVHTTGDGTHTALVFGELLAQGGRPFSQLQDVHADAAAAREPAGRVKAAARIAAAISGRAGRRAGAVERPGPHPRPLLRHRE